MLAAIIIYFLDATTHHMFTVISSVILKMSPVVFGLLFHLATVDGEQGLFFSSLGEISYGFALPLLELYPSELTTKTTVMIKSNDTIKLYKLYNFKTWFKNLLLLPILPLSS